MYEGRNNIDIIVAQNKYGCPYIFHTLWLARPRQYSTSCIQNLMYFHTPKTIVHFCDIFDEILLFILEPKIHSNFVLRPPAVEETVLCIVYVCVFLNKLLHPPYIPVDLKRSLLTLVSGDKKINF